MFLTSSDGLCIWKAMNLGQREKYNAVHRSFFPFVTWLNEIRQKKGMPQGQGPYNTDLLPNTALSSSKTLFSFTWSSLRWSLASASNCGWKEEYLVWTQRAVCCPLQCFSSLLRLHLISRWTIPTGLCQVGCSPSSTCCCCYRSCEIISRYLPKKQQVISPGSYTLQYPSWCLWNWERKAMWTPCVQECI